MRCKKDFKRYISKLLLTCYLNIKPSMRLSQYKSNDIIFILIFRSRIYKLYTHGNDQPKILRMFDSKPLFYTFEYSEIHMYR